MNYFEISDKINQNKHLSLQEKAVFNQVLSYELNKKEFFGTNEYLANYWNTSVRSINRVFAKLESRNLIQRRTERKKHSNGQQNWYNKRYTTINFDGLAQLLSVGFFPPATEERTVTQPKTEIPSVKVATEQPTPEEGCYFGGNYPQQDNEYSRVFGTQIESNDLAKILAFARSLVGTGKESMATWLLTNHQNWDADKIMGVYEALQDNVAA